MSGRRGMWEEKILAPDTYYWAWIICFPRVFWQLAEHWYIKNIHILTLHSKFFCKSKSHVLIPQDAEPPLSPRGSQFAAGWAVSHWYGHANAAGKLEFPSRQTSSRAACASLLHYCRLLLCAWGLVLQELTAALLSVAEGCKARFLA